MVFFLPLFLIKQKAEKLFFSESYPEQTKQQPGVNDEKMHTHELHPCLHKTRLCTHLLAYKSSMPITHCSAPPTGGAGRGSSVKPLMYSRTNIIEVRTLRYELMFKDSKRQQLLGYFSLLVAYGFFFLSLFSCLSRSTCASLSCSAVTLSRGRFSSLFCSESVAKPSIKMCFTTLKPLLNLCNLLSTLVLKRY